MAGDTFFGSSLPAGSQHVGRRWTGPDSISFECDCPKTACGLTVWGIWNTECEFHGWDKTIRQSHSPENCPASR